MGEERSLVDVPLALPGHQAMALAQLVKRIGWTEVRALAIDEHETRAMILALGTLRDALGEVGYAPR